MKGPASPRGERTWRDRWRAWRDRRLLDPAFHRWASRSWWGRAIARRESRALFDLVAGFTYSQVLFACVRLKLFRHLADQGPQDTAALAHWMALPEEGAHRLLAAGASLRLLERHDDGRWGLGPLGAPMVVHPAISAMVEHHATLYHDLADPVALLRGERPATAMSGYWPYADTDPGAAPARLGPERVAEYSQLMSVSQPLVSEQVLQSYPLDQHRRLLDVGGGEGTFLRAVAAHAPHLQLMLFDLPAVADLARQRLAEQGLADRVEIHGGSFFSDPLPRGADLITLVRVLFDHPDDRVRQILRSVREALPDQGAVLVCEPMSGTPGAEAIGDAYYGLYLAAMGKGRSRSPAELTALLRSAGFSQVRLLPTPLPLQTRVLLARR
jgi:demethylspheroidene O-methyltransferase